MDLRNADPALFDVATHVVELNKLITELNKVTRQTYKPSYQTIDNLATEIRHHAAMLQRICDGLRGL
jgi:hypothetical protein